MIQPSSGKLSFESLRKAALCAAFAASVTSVRAAETAPTPVIVKTPALDDKHPAYPMATDPTVLLKNYDTVFRNSVPAVGGPGKGVPAENLSAAIKPVRETLGIVRSADGRLTGKPILGKGGIGWHAFEMILKGLSDTYYKANADQRKTLLPAITDCLEYFNRTVDSSHQSWTQWANYGAYRPQFRNPFWLAHIVPEEIGDTFVERVFHLAALSIGEARVNLQMDHLKGYAAMALNMPSAIRNPARRLALAQKAHAYATALILAEGNFTPEGAPMHHGIWHYYYARYSTFEFFDALVNFHRAGFYFPPAAYERIQRVARAAAVSIAGSQGIYPLNGNGRSGQILPLGDTTKLWVRSAALTGTPTDPKAPNPEFASIYAYAWPQDPLAKSFVAQGIRPAPVPDIDLTMNIGATNVHRRKGWNLQTAGLSPASGKHEIYSWVQYNNYSRYVRWGSHIITDPSFSSPETEGGYMANHGFNWAFIPGVTSPATPPHRLIVRAKNNHIQNGAACGGCSLELDGMWMMDSLWGPTDCKKSAFFFGERATYITTNIAAKSPKDATPGEKTVHTTLAQWPVTGASAPLRVGARTVTAQPTLAELPLAQPLTVVDSKDNAYILEPDAHAKLAYRRGPQTYPMLADGYLKTQPSPFNWHGPTVNGKGFNDKTLLDAEALVTPRAGDFEIAYVEHDLKDGSDAAGVAYHLLPRAGVAAAAAFNRRLAQPKPPCAILRRDRKAHILLDNDSATYAYAIFEPTEINLGPLVSMSTPGTIMFREKPAGSFLVAIATPLDKTIKDTEFVVRGRYDAVEPGIGSAFEVTHPDANRTVIKWLAHSYTATTLRLRPAAK